jgi:DNA-binding response OmpR family regulator
MNTLTILIVDDDPDLCHLLGGILRMKKFEVGVAPDLRTASDCIKDINPSIIFLDHNLPDGTGIDFISTINEINNQIKIVVMTADSTPGIETKALSMGADHFLVKPFSFAIINNVVDKLLNNQSSTLTRSGK